MKKHSDCSLGKPLAVVKFMPDGEYVAVTDEKRMLEVAERLVAVAQSMMACVEEKGIKQRIKKGSPILMKGILFALLDKMEDDKLREVALFAESVSKGR